ncbi:MAG: hypothetical protein R3174_10820 [Gammaproteobacteria bacterium]|nr:hypothetical protein [Gammaproteobacteria bacterium]
MNRTERDGAPGARAPNAWLAGLCLLLVPALSAAQPNELPEGFGGIAVGDRYEDVAAKYELQNLDGLATSWDTFLQDCGYRNVRLDAEKGELLLTFNDFVVTRLSYITPIKPDTDLLAVADLVMQSYGQPDIASMRSIFGKVTIDKDEVNFITLTYRTPRRVEFTISGRELWEYRITVYSDKHRWHENATTRCARDKEKAAASTAATTGESTTQ